MIPFLLGERVYLRPLCDEDISGGYPLWFNSASVCAGNSHHVYPYTEAEGMEYIRYASATKTDLILAIIAGSMEVHIGNVALQNIHPIYRSADFAIVIGEDRYWGKGYGYEAASLIINHGFMELGLLRIACATLDNNHGMQKLAVKLGMRLEGTRVAAAYKSGEFLNVVEFGILREEWMK